MWPPEKASGQDHLQTQNQARRLWIFFVKETKAEEPVQAKREEPDVETLSQYWNDYKDKSKWLVVVTISASSNPFFHFLINKAFHLISIHY